MTILFKTTRHSRYVRYFLLLFCAAFPLSCSSLNNRIDDVALNCGVDFRGSRDYFVVVDPEGRRLKGSDVEIADLGDNNRSGLVVSSKGCISAPKSGTILVKSKVSNWAKEFDAKGGVPGEVLTLRDYSGEHVTLLCNDKDRISIASSFPLSSLVKANIDPSLQLSYQLDYELLSEGGGSLAKNSVNLAALGTDVRAFVYLPDEGAYTLNIRVRSLLAKKIEESASCRFRLDRSPPDVNFAVNLRSDFNTAVIHGKAGFALVNLGDEISLNSDDGDVREVEYCAVQVDDEFEDKDPLRLRQWSEAFQSLSCEGTMLKTEANKPISLGPKSGIWTVKYRAIDSLGNLSMMKSSQFLYFHNDKVDLVRGITKDRVGNAILENRNLDATLAALKAYKIQDDLPTRYERELIDSIVFVSLLRVSDIQTVDFSIDDPESDRLAPIAATSRNASQALAFSRDGLVIAAHSGFRRSTIRVIEAATGKLLRVLDDGSGSSIQDLRFSSDSKSLFSISESGLVTLWDVKGGVALKTLELGHEKDEKFKIFASSKSNFLLISQGDMVTFFSSNLDPLTLSENLRSSLLGLVPLAENPTKGDVIFGAPGAHVLKIKNLEAESTEINLEGPTTEIVQVEYNADGSKIFGRTSNEVVWIWSAEDGKYLDAVQLPAALQVRDMRPSEDGEGIDIFTATNKKLTYRLADRSFKESSDFAVSDFGHAFSPNARVMIGTNYNGHLKITTKIRPMLESYFQNSGQKLDGFFTYAGLSDLILTVKPGGRLGLFDVDSRQEVKLPFQSHWVAGDFSYLISPDLSKMIKNPENADYTILSLAPADGPVLISRNLPSRMMTTISSDSKVMVQTLGTVLNLIDLSSGKTLRTIELGEKPCALTLNQSNTVVFVALTSGPVQSYELASGRPIKVYRGNQSRTRSLLLNPDESILYSGDQSGVIRTWSVDSGAEGLLFRGEPSLPGTIMNLNHKGRLLFTIYNQKSDIWDTSSGESLGALNDLGRFSLMLNAKDQMISEENRGISVAEFSSKGLKDKICSVIQPYLGAGGRSSDAALCL